MQVASAPQIDPEPQPAVATLSPRASAFAFGNVLFSCIGAPDTTGEQGAPDKKHPSDGGSPQAMISLGNLPLARIWHGNPEVKKVERIEPQTSVPSGSGAVDIAPAVPISSPDIPNIQDPRTAHQSATPPEHPGTPTPALASSNLAFAMRIDSNAANSNQAPKVLTDVSSGTSDTEPVGRSPHSPVIVEAISNGAQQYETNTSNKDGQGLAGEEQPALPLRASAPASPETAQTTRTDFEAELKHTTETVRAAHVQVVGNDNQRVDIQLFEKGGSLAVTVKTSDSSLTRDLQDHIPELTARLQSEHLHSQAWAPSGSSSSHTRDGNDSGSNPSQDNSQSGGGRQQKREQDNKPQWVQDLEENQRNSTIKETFHVSSY